MRIVVRREHIEKAIKKDSHHCMIADAIKDHLAVTFILVDTQSIRYTDLALKERYVYFTPPAAQEMILKWDKGIHVQPFAFELGSPVKIEKVRSKWTGKKSILAKARAKYEETTRKDKMFPRLIKESKE